MHQGIHLRGNKTTTDRCEWLVASVNYQGELDAAPVGPKIEKYCVCYSARTITHYTSKHKRGNMHADFPDWSVWQKRHRREAWWACARERLTPNSRYML